MTQAKIVTNPAEGHGLTDRLTDPHFSALTKGEPVGLIPALVLLKPHGYGGNVTANGEHRHVRGAEKLAEDDDDAPPAVLSDGIGDGEGSGEDSHLDDDDLDTADDDPAASE